MTENPFSSGGLSAWEPLYASFHAKLSLTLL